jgi:peptidyl-prolyl cis-trans isomerase SurA
MNLRAALIPVLFLVVLATPAGAVLVDRVEAVVNKGAIFLSDFERFRSLIPLRAKIDPLFINEPIGRKAKPSDPDILDYLIDEALILDKFPVPDAEVEQEINVIQNNLKIDRQALKSAIGREGYGFEDYFRLMRISIAKRNLIDREIRNKTAVSEDDLRAEYNRAHSGSKSFGGSFRLFLIRISKANYKSAAAAREEAAGALAALKNGESFEEVAKRFSEDPSHESGGDLGYLAYGEMSPEIQAEVRRLGPEKTGEVIEDRNSFLIVRVGDIKFDTDSAYEREKDSIRARLMEGEFRHQVRLWLDRERALNHVKVNQRSP